MRSELDELRKVVKAVRQWTDTTITDRQLHDTYNEYEMDKRTDWCPKCKHEMKADSKPIEFLCRERYRALNLSGMKCLYCSRFFASEETLRELLDRLVAGEKE